MGVITLYHGSPNKVVIPQYGCGDDKHDYGRGFYLTDDIELAKEWAVCRPDEKNGCVLVKLFGNTLFGNYAPYRTSIGVI